MTPVNTHKPISMRSHMGFSMVELMVSLTVASVLSIAVVSAFSAQSTVYVKQAQRIQSNDDGRQAFDVLSRLLRHANAASITITNQHTAGGNSNLVAFSLPSGFPIWPNNAGSYSDNHIFIKWADNNADGNVANQIRIAKSTDATTPANDSFMALAGVNSGNNTRITAFNLVKQADGLNYKMTLVARTGSAIGGADTYFEGMILPRN